MKKSTYNIIAGAAALVGVYYLYIYFSKNKKTNTVNTTVAKNTTVPIKESVGGTFPLKKGSKGKLVELLQSALGGRKNLPLFGIDGDFGNETERAVVKYLGKKTVNNKSEMDKIANLNNLAFDTTTNSYITPKGGVTIKSIDELIRVNK